MKKKIAMCLCLFLITGFIPVHAEVREGLDIENQELAQQEHEANETVETKETVEVTEKKEAEEIEAEELLESLPKENLGAEKGKGPSEIRTETLPEDFVYQITASKGEESYTVHCPYSGGYYGTVDTAFLGKRKDGSYERVEAIGQEVVIETFDESFSYIGQKKIAFELYWFGGYFNGKENRFLVFGQSNPEESLDAEVIRIVKYDDNWNRLGACSVYGANTSVPFSAGGLSMTETEDTLYIHTCHSMFKTSDGYNHQANCTFAVKKSDMSLEDSSTDISNFGTGYVSHSFMQFIRTDGEKIYRADLGDAYPRGITLTSTLIGYPLALPDQGQVIVSIPGGIGQNYTGFSLSGLELSTDGYLVTGYGLKAAGSKKNNIFLQIGKKDSFSQEIQWMTDDSDNSNIIVGEPKLVKQGASQFLLMWEEYDSSDKTYQTKIVQINEDSLSEKYAVPLPLSACAPLVETDGTVTWYATNDSSPVFMKIDPSDLSKLQEACKDEKIFQRQESPSENGQQQIQGDGGIQGSEIAVSKIRLSAISHKIANGKKIRISAKVYPENAANKKIVWKSSNPKVATVDSSGMVTVKKNTGGRSATITATVDGVKASYKIISMKGAVKKISISGKKTAKAGKSVKLKAKLSASKGANKTVKWSSSNPQIATVSSSGKVKAFQKGTVKITVSATDGSNKKKTVTMKIK